MKASDSFINIIQLWVCFNFTTILATSLIVNPTPQSATEGQSVIFPCQFSRNAESCGWQFDDTPVIVKKIKDYSISEKKEKGFCDLTIRNIDIQRDGGAWKCYLPHPNGVSSPPVNLTVIVNPTPPVLWYEVKDNAINNTVISVKNGISITLICETRFGNPESRLLWKLEDNTINSSAVEIISAEETRHKLKKTTSKLNLRINRTLDNKKIACISLHENITQKASGLFNVTYGTTTVNITSGSHVSAKVGETVLFTCKADGNPPPAYKWRFKPENDTKWKVIGYSDILIIVAAHELAGRYMCTVENSDSSYSETTLKVIEKESIMLTKVIIPVVVSLGLVVIVIIVIVGILLRKKKSKHSDQPSSAFYINPTIITDDQPDLTKPVRNTDEHGYLVTRRPLPKIKDADQYVGFDPAADTVRVENTSPVTSQKRNSNIYEDPHIYENTL